MKHIILDALTYVPFLIVTNQDGKLKFDISISEVLRSVIVPLIIGALGVYVTVQLMKKDIEFQATTLSRIETKVESICNEIARINTDLAIVKTRQDERLERERAQGIRK